MPANANQAAFIAKLIALSNALASVQQACQDFSNFEAHFPAGSLPKAHADVAAVLAGIAPLKAQIDDDIANDSEATALA